MQVVFYGNILPLESYSSITKSYIDLCQASIKLVTYRLYHLGGSTWFSNGNDLVPRAAQDILRFSKARLIINTKNAEKPSTK